MAIWFALPKMGAIFDQAKLEIAGGEAAFAALRGDALAQVLRSASIESFQAVAIIPLILLPVFGAIWLFDRRKTG
jgi:hypothetical protein